MNITWETYEYGRAGELKKLNEARNNFTLHPLNRRRADNAHQTIVAQLKDLPLMRMRERLIKAAKDGNPIELNKIQLQMRDYLGESKEHGDYEY